MSVSEILNYTRHLHLTQNEEVIYLPNQLGSHIIQIHDAEQDISNIDIILLGCGETRGQYPGKKEMGHSPDVIRRELYQLYCWHPEIKIGDLGNILQGETLADSKAAIRSVLGELNQLGKRVLILGGSHDITLQQYEVCKLQQKIIDFTVIDMLVDLNEFANTDYNTYLMEALTSSPNFVRQFNLIGFQSYYANPNLIETFDKLRFDCIRLGKAREDLDQLEPIIRSSHVLSVDMNAIKYADAPANKFASPNGFHGDEICKIMQFAGMSDALESVGIYGYLPEQDQENMTARLISQMIWYYIDGIRIQKNESPLSHRDQFLEYQITFTDNNCTFLKSKHTNRWWMQLNNESYVPCTYKDYVTACQNEMPERWLREMERIV